MSLAALRLPACIIALQVAFLILFAIFVRYPKLGLPTVAGPKTNGDDVRNGTWYDDDGETVESGAHAHAAPHDHLEHGAASKREVAQYYPCKCTVCK